MSRNFRKLIERKWSERKFVCVGLDSDLKKIPHSVTCLRSSVREILTVFNRGIIDFTHSYVAAYKPNIAFYEAFGPDGLYALRETIGYINTAAPDVPVIIDAKRADIGNTNEGYVDALFGYYNADAITVHPYLGREALQPFLDQKDKGVFVLCRTSNPGAGEFQDKRIQKPAVIMGVDEDDKEPLYEVVARRVATDWNANSNCGLVVGATYPDELERVRSIVGDMPILIPGVGAQGGDVEATVKAGKDGRGQGMIINSSRGIIFASSGADFAEAARRETERLHNLINQCR